MPGAAFRQKQPGAARHRCRAAPGWETSVAWTDAGSTYGLPLDDPQGEVPLPAAQAGGLDTVLAPGGAGADDLRIDVEVRAVVVPGHFLPGGVLDAEVRVEILRHHIDLVSPTG